jgi:hypothetical protein
LAKIEAEEAEAAEMEEEDNTAGTEKWMMDLSVGVVYSSNVIKRHLCHSPCIVGLSEPASEHQDHKPPSARTLETEPMPEPQPHLACAQDEAEAAEMEDEDNLLEPKPDNGQLYQVPQPKHLQDHEPPSARMLVPELEPMLEPLPPSACAQDKAEAAEMEVEYDTVESPSASSLEPEPEPMSPEPEPPAEKMGFKGKRATKIVGWYGEPEGRSLYCLNLNCRAPLRRLFRSDLSKR